MLHPTNPLLARLPDQSQVEAHISDDGSGLPGGCWAVNIHHGGFIQPRYEEAWLKNKQEICRKAPLVPLSFNVMLQDIFPCARFAETCKVQLPGLAPAPQDQSARACAWQDISAEGHAGCAVGVVTFLILTSMLTLQEMIVAGTSHCDSWGSERRWLPPTRPNCENGPSERSVIYSGAVQRRHTSLVLDAVSSSLVVPVVFRTCVSTYWLEDQLHQHHEAKKVCIT